MDRRIIQVNGALKQTLQESSQVDEFGHLTIEQICQE